MNENDQTLPPVDESQDSAKRRLADALAEVPDRLRGKSRILTLADAVRELALESDLAEEVMRESDKRHIQARCEIEDALLEIPPRFRQGQNLVPSIQALVQALSDAEGAAIALAIRAEPVEESRDATGQAEYRRGRLELAEELAAAVGEYPPSKAVWHYAMGYLDSIRDQK